MGHNQYQELDKCFIEGYSYLAEKVWPLVEDDDNAKKVRMIKKVIDSFYNASLGTQIPAEIKPTIRGMKADLAKVERRAG